MTPSVDVIIVNWNAGSVLPRSVDSVVRSMSNAFRANIVLIDNASADDSLDRVTTVGGPVRIIRNELNRGFARACNQGAAGSRADYLLFLNPDVVLEPDALAASIAFMHCDAQRDVGVVGIQLVGANGEIMRTCTRRPTAVDFVNTVLRLDRVSPWFTTHRLLGWDHRQTCEVGHVTGAFYLVRRAVFEQVGGFDEQFFAYYEDLDFSVRAYHAGWRSVYLAGVRAYHRGGWQSDVGRAWRLCHDWRSRIQYAHKHFGPSATTAVVLGTLVVEPLVPIASAILTRSLRPVKEALRAYGLMCRSLARRSPVSADEN